MGDQDAFERILASLYEAMLDETLWPATSALIDEACGMEGSILGAGVGPPDDVRPFFLGLCYRGQRREDWEREYLSLYHPIDERIPRLRQLPDSRIVHVTDMYTAEERKTSPVYNDALRRTSMQDGVNVHLDLSESSYVAWCTADPITRGGWGAAQLALFTGLLPHVRQFVRIRQALAQAEALGMSETALLDTTRAGVIHLDRWGRIVEANDRARAILQQGDGVSDRGGMLSAVVPADQTRLERLVAAALPTAGAVAVSGSMRLHRTSALPPFVVHVKPVDGRQRNFGAWHVVALVLLTEPGHGARIDPARLATALGLTPVESRIAAWVTEGRTVHEIAGALDQTEGSVRWYLHQIYHKQGLSGQVALARRVLAVARLA